MNSKGETPPSVDELLEEGLTLYGLGRFEEAAAKWNQALDMDPGNAQALEYIDIVSEDLGEKPPEQPLPHTAPPQPADREPTRQPSPPVNVSELLSKGIDLLERGRLDESYKVFQQAAETGNNNPDIFGYLELARTAKLEHYKNQLKNLDVVPKIAMDYDTIKGLNLSKEEGFVLSQIDGMISFRDIMSLARIEKLEAMGILTKLLDEGVIEVSA